MARKKKSLDPRNFGSRTDDEIMSVVSEDMKRSETYQQPYFDKFAEFYRQYNCVRLGLRPNGSNLFIPYIYNIIETALPKILGPVFEAKPFITYKPIGTADTRKGEILTNLIYYQMKRLMKASTRMYEIYKSTLMYGTAISKQTWKYKEKEIMVRKEQEHEIPMDDGTIAKVPVRVPVKTKKVVYDAPEMKNIPIESIYFDPAFTDVDESPFICHEYWKELHELQIGERVGYYKNVSKISEEKQDGPLKNKYDSSGAVIGDMAHGVRIWEYWTDDWLVTIANKGTVIKVEENPYFHRSKPFIKWCAVLMPNEWYGKSMIETLVDLQSELNTLRNQRIDNVSLAINRMFLINKGSGVDPAQLISRPNGFIEVDDVDKDVKELTVSDVTASAYKDEEIVKLDMDVTSGVHNHDRGQPGERRETATVASLMSSASSERFRMQILMMEEDPLTELGKQLAELNKQFLDDETHILITGEDGQTVSEPVSFADIDIEYDVIASGTATDVAANKEVRKGQLIQLLNVALGNPQVRQPELLKQIFREFDFKNFEGMVMTDEEVLQKQMEMQQIAAQAQQPQGQPTPETATAPTSLTAEFNALMGGGDVGGQDVAGLYPQMGGVGGLGQYLQDPAVQTPK